MLMQCGAAWAMTLIKVMADGCVCLAQLWDSAWEEGGGDRTIHDFNSIDETRLERLYQNPELSSVAHDRYDRPSSPREPFATDNDAEICSLGP